MLSKFNNKKHRRLTALLLCVALMLGSVTSVSADISAADSETEVQNYAEEPTTEAVSYETPEAQTEVQEGTPVAEETEAPAADTQQTEAHTEAATEAHTETAAETQVAETTETATEKVWTAQVGNATVKVTGTEGALPEDAQLRVNEITAGNGKEEIENAVAEQMADNKEEASIQNVLAYDIKFIQNGQEVQPTTPVQVSVDSPEIASDEETAVYHVDDNNNVEDMDGNVDAEGNVVFEAPHFSTYVIINKGSSNITVTLQHYDYGSKKKLYSDEAVPLSTGSKINNYCKSGNYEVTEVYEITYDADGKEVQTKLDNKDNITAMKSTTYRIYYTPNTGTTTGDVTLWDYDKINSTSKGINRNSNYTDTEGKTPRLIMGVKDKNDSLFKSKKYTDATGTNDLNANVCNYGKNTNNKGTLGLVTGLSDDYSTVLWSCDQPGFFTETNASSESGKTVYKNYHLEFNRTGNSYTLANVITPTGAKKHSGSDFWPLGHEEYYFGMRYDVTFKLGDYVGDLNYKFTGDDDLWVLLDGEVVIDVGGIHDALTGSVDLWEALGFEYGARPTTTDEKNAEHRITVLYMERGAGASNCEMEFTLPNARLLNVENTPIAQMSFVKVNTKNEALKDATFVLKNDETGEEQVVTSDEQGTVNFSNLVAGTYILTEKVAPNGYAVSNTPWKVVVTATDTTATAKLYESNGTTEVAKTDNGTYKIINLSQEEQAKLLVDYDKTAKVTDWENRKYDIDITASSKLTTSTTQESGGVADVMLVLDASGSMGEVLDEYLYVGANDPDTRKNLNSKTTYYLKYQDKYYQIYYSNTWVWINNDWERLSNLSGDIYCEATRLDALKSAATQFITDTATTSPTSNVGISVFSSKGYGNHGDKMSLSAVGTNKDTLISFINELNANGGTDPAVGLQDAYDKLKTASDGGDTLPKYVILFTDGEPTGGGNTWDTTAQTEAEAKAKELKDMGVKVYTIGFALNNKTKTFLAGGEYDGTTYPGIASPGCAMVADDASKLAEIFKTIQSTITQDCDINNATVVDVIDPRFVILDDDGKQITEEYLKDKKDASVKLANGGTVYYENGKQYIRWTEQTIKSQDKNSQDKKEGWHKTITVQAQDDYIGGNNVPTNISPDSKIITSYGELTLPQPKVNVKAELTLKDKEITIYKGDSVPSAKTVLEEMVDKYTDNVNKYSVSENQFDAKWYTADALKDNKENFNDKTATTSGVVGTAVINDTTYYLKVTYDAGAPSDESNKNTTLRVNDKDTVYSAGDDTTHKVEAVKIATDTTTKRAYGIYQINVISGTIQIVKKLETPATEDKTFTFVVKKAEGNVVARVPVTVIANETEATVTDEDALATLTNLARGTYTVEEEEQTGYMLDSAVSDTVTNCQNSTANTKVTFVLGNNSVLPNENVIKNYTYKLEDGGTLGKAIFTNEPVYSKWQIIKVSASNHEKRLAGAIFELSIADVKYYGKSGDAGIVEWYRNYQKDNGKVSNKITIPDELPEGTYTLKEIKAPTGYVLSSNTYTLQITKTGALKAVKVNGTELTPELQKNGEYHILIENAVIYNLPNSGGSGIYWFSICGMLLMMAAAWIIYKNKCREVLVK